MVLSPKTIQALRELEKLSIQQVAEGCKIQLVRELYSLINGYRSWDEHAHEVYIEKHLGGDLDDYY